MDRTPFLHGALSWLFDGEPPPSCPECGFVWTASFGDAKALIAGSPPRFDDALRNGDGMAPPADGSWNATAYVWHLTDLARSWAERWVQLEAAPGSALVGWDPDDLAEVRRYRLLPTSAGLWALAAAVESLMSRTEALSADTPFQHGDWGAGNVADALVWLGHEFQHHLGDVQERVG